MNGRGSPRPRNLNGAAIFLCASLIAITVMATPSSAQNGDTSNAATWYQRAWEAQWRVSNDEWFALDVFRAQGGRPSDEVRAVLRKVAPLLDDARRATNQGFADFGVLPGDPEGHRVEHTSKLRSIIRWIDADVKARIADGDAMGAASQIASMYRMIAHSGDGRTMLSSLIAASMSRFPEAALDFALEDRALGAAELTTVLRAMESLDERDPFQAVNALAWEQAELEQLMDHAQRPEAEGGVLALLDRIGYPPAMVAGMERMTEPQLIAEVAAYHDLLGRFITIHESDDPAWAAQEVERLKSQAANGDLGPLCAAAVPMLARFHESVTTLHQMLDARESLLRGLIEGEVDGLDLANAAVFYRRGIALLESIDSPWQEVLQRLRTHSGAEAPAEEVAALQTERRTIDAAIVEFTHGSLIRRCDFSTRRIDEEHFIPEYAPGMNRALGVLLVRAESLADLDRRDEALAHLSVCFRVIHHLGSDGLTLSAVESHDAFVSCAAAARRVLALPGGEGAGDLTSDRLAELAAAIRRTGPRDPFGYEAALRPINDKTERYLLGCIAYAFDEWREDAVMSAGHAAAAARGREWLGALAPAQRWYVFGLIMLSDVSDRAVVPRIRRRAERYLRPSIDTIVDLAEMDAPLLREVSGSGRFERLAVPPMEELLDISLRRLRAGTDQRNGAELAEALTAVGRSLPPRGDRLDQASSGGSKEDP